MATHHHGRSPRHWTKFQRQKNDSRFIFKKTIAGHYRNGRTGYNRVGVLLITWEEDDMHLEESEVGRLQKIFEEHFRFETKYFRIPSINSDTGLLHTVTEFIHKYNSPDNLMIVYYGGHGYEGKETNLFKLAAKLEADGNGDPTTFFDDIFMCLRLPQSDILFILDCCFAAQAFSKVGLGKRKYELIAAAAPKTLVPSAKHQNSFTYHLSETLLKMLSEPKHANGFSTSDLYRRVYHQRGDLVKPFLFDQSLHDYGRIWLQPQKVPETQLEDRVKHTASISLTLQMTSIPSPAQVNELARALQYLPHVNEIEFGDMRAPAEEILGFVYGMRKVMYVRKLIQSLRERIAAKKKLEMEANTGKPVTFRQLSLRTAPAADHFQSPDWSAAEAVLGKRCKLPVSMVTGKTPTQSPVAEKLPPFKWPTPLKPQGFIDGLFVACSVISGHIRPHSPWEENKIFLADSHLLKGDEVAGPRMKEETVRKRTPSMASVALAIVKIAEHERRMQILDRLMWVATLIGVLVIFFIFV